MNRIVAVIVFIVSFCNVAVAQTELWGMTKQGGSNGGGVIFKTDSTGNNQVVEYSFDKIDGSSPFYSSLVQAPDGNMYGLTSAGGEYYSGILFQYNPVTNTFIKKIDFDGPLLGAQPKGSLMIASNGKMYGVTSLGGDNNDGVLFEYDYVTNTIIKIADFDDIALGRYPIGDLTEALDGKLYGTANGGSTGSGIIYQYDILTNTFAKKIDFDENTTGKNIYSRLTLGNDNSFYTVTMSGGSNNKGTLVKYDYTTNSLLKIIDFTDGGSIGGLLNASNGKLYGTIQNGGLYGRGTIFEYDPSTITYTVKKEFGYADGAGLMCHLIENSPGILYGMSNSGGLNNIGTIFQYDIALDNLITQFSFSGTDGKLPLGSFIKTTDGKFYALTSEGGELNMGVLFQYNPLTNSCVKKLDFQKSLNGQHPNGSLVRASNGLLYGVAEEGGLNNKGVLFQFDQVNHVYTKLIDFANTVGANPNGSLIQATDGMLYGTCYNGAGFGSTGTIFQFNPNTYSLSTIYSFGSSSMGDNPRGALVQASNGLFYGTTSYGGWYSKGTIFEFDPVSGIYNDKYNFIDAVGRAAIGSLIEAADGNLYGVTMLGGALDQGTLFQYNYINNIFTKQIDFSSVSIGRRPGEDASLLQATDGMMYGTTMYGGSNGYGILYKFNPDSLLLYDRLNFNSIPDGSYPSAPLVQTSQGKLFGSTWAGGTNITGGTIFHYNSASNTAIKKIDFLNSNGFRSSSALIEISNYKQLSSSVLNPTLCVNNTLNISYTLTGLYNQGNVISLELSDANGSFLNAVVIKTLSIVSNSTGMVSAHVPLSTPLGSGYRVRFKSSNPILIGNDNGTDITINTLPVVTVFTNPSVICNGSFFDLIASGASDYVWNDFSINDTLKYIFSSSNSYTVVGTDINGCVNTATIATQLDTTCQYVYPGDVNNDWEVSNLDVLELGLHFSKSGISRSILGNNWQPHFANNWIDTLSNGRNLNHADCDGSGNINLDDTLAIYNNYYSYRTYKSPANTETDPQLTIVPNETMVAAGNWGSASIYLGSVSSPVNDVNGIAFTLYYDNNLIDTNQVWLEYPNSFIDVSGQNLHFRKLDFSNGYFYATTTHTLNNNVNGNGLIGVLHYKILSTLNNDGVMYLGMYQAFKSDAFGKISQLTAGTGSVMAVGISVGLQQLNINKITISPNPTNGSLSIHSKTELQKIEIVAITGQILMNDIPTNVSHTLHLENLSNGIYFINVYQNDRIVKREKVVLNK
ncbi:MAG: choice-of-anchor tandem repeat GloVer-containing protein [Bacteroidota bacterium]